MHQTIFDTDWWDERSEEQAQESVKTAQNALEGQLEDVAVESLLREVVDSSAGATYSHIKTAELLADTTASLDQLLGSMQSADVKNQMELLNRHNDMRSNLNQLSTNAEEIANTNDEVEKLGLYQDRKVLLEDAYSDIPPYVREAHGSPVDGVEFDYWEVISEQGGLVGNLGSFFGGNTYGTIRGQSESFRQHLVTDYYATTAYIQNEESDQNLAKSVDKSMPPQRLDYSQTEAVVFDTLETPADYAKYRITVTDDMTDNDNLVVRIGGPQADDIEAYLSNTEQNPDFPSGDTFGSDNRAEISGLSPGEYYVLVEPDETAGPYRLTARVDTGWWSRGTAPNLEVLDTADIETYPDPEITDISVPSTVEKDQSITVEVSATNQGGKSDWQSIAVSLPKVASSSSVSVVSHNLDGVNRWEPGDEDETPGQVGFGAEYGVDWTDLSYVLVEGSYQGWSSGTERTMQIEIDPQEAGEFPVYVKSVAVGNNVWKSDPGIGETTVRDQQNEFVKKKVVEVVDPNPANFEVSIDDTNSPVTEGEDLTVDATVTNTGDESDTQTIQLDAESLGDDSKSVSLDGGQSESVTLSVPTETGDGGSYTAEVSSDDDTDTISVTVNLDSEAATVYAGSADGGLYAVDGETGEKEWEFKEPEGIVQSSPTVVSGTVYFGSNDNTLYAVDAETGEKDWSFDEPESNIESSPTVVGGTVYVGSNGGKLYAVDAETGNQEWEFAGGSVGLASVDSPTVVDGTVYVAGVVLYAVDAETGQKKWVSSDPMRVDSSPTVYEGTVYVTSEESILYALDAETGESRWEFETEYGMNSAPTVVENTVYFVTEAEYNSGDNSWQGGNLYAVNTENGEKEWEFTESDGQGKSPPTVADGTVYAVAGGQLYAVDKETGGREWVFEDNSISVDSPPTVAENTVYVGGNDILLQTEALYGVDATTGDLSWEFTGQSDQDLPSSPTVVKDPAGGDSIDSRVNLGTLGHHHVWAEEARIDTNFEVEITGTNSPVNEGGTLDVDVEITNTGYTSGTQMVELNIDGLGSDSESVTVGGEDSSEVTLSVPTETGDGGSYTAVVESEDDNDTEGVTVATVDPTVYVGSSNNNVYAVDAYDGTKKWSFGTDANVGSSPTVVDGTLYVGSGNHSSGNLHALDASDGEEVWSFETDGSVTSPTIVGGTVYFGSDDTLYAVDAKSGDIKWEFTESSIASILTPNNAPTVVDGTVYFGSAESEGPVGSEEYGALYAVNAETGEKKWVFTEPDDFVNSAPTVADGVAYVGRNTLYAVDTETGNKTLIPIHCT